MSNWRQILADPAHRARALQIAGLVLALVGLIGAWSSRNALGDDLGAAQRELLGLEGNEQALSFVVAGRDLFYGEGTATPIYDAEGTITGWDFDGEVGSRGVNTDTILYVNLVGNDLTMIAIPRDLFVGMGTRRINGVLAREGTEGLMQRVENAVGLPVNDYVIIDLDIFRSVVDALGGVEVNVPERMYYRDVAGGLTIDLQAGPQVLDGQAASEFLRYRQFVRGDIDRLDNVKRLAYAMLARIKELNVRAVGVVPDLISTYFEQVETSVSPTLLARLLPRLADLEIRSATLPTLEVERDGSMGLIADPVEVQAFLASTFGGTAREFLNAPERTLLISDRSGVDGLGDWYRDRLVGMGVPEDRIVVREGSFEPSGTRILATAETWSDADYYAGLLGTGKQQVEALGWMAGSWIEIELVLGGDAYTLTPMGAAASRSSNLVVPGDPTDDAALASQEP